MSLAALALGVFVLAHMAAIPSALAQFDVGGYSQNTDQDADQDSVYDDNPAVRSLIKSFNDANAESPATLPSLLSEADESRYRVIFDLQALGDWKAADKIIGGLENRDLMGHVMAQRYLHPTKYRSRYKELKSWMDDYADHPEATRIYKLALKRRPKNWRMPKEPMVFQASSKAAVTAPVNRIYAPRKKLSKEDRRKYLALKRKLNHYSRNGWTKAYKEQLKDAETKRLFHPVSYDREQSRLATNYYGDGRDDWALMWATRATDRSGKYLPTAHWTAALAAWRLGKFELARKHFLAVTENEYASSWLVSAGAFWAARASIKIRQPEEFVRHLKDAAGHPRTFYGMLAQRLLGVEAKFNWAPPPLAEEALAELALAPGGRRAVMLLQVGEDHRAEAELKGLFGKTSPKLARAMLALADRAEMPSLAMRLGNLLVRNGSDLYDSTAYPAPRLSVREGEVIDRELILALIRQESGFNPKAKSHRGARGLMQIMPGTASFVAKDRKLRGSKRHTLYDPETNLELGQRYIDILMDDRSIEGDMFRMVTAWNAGPGNVRKWLRNIKHQDDPLLFIESIPSRETRIFVERVMTNYWIYRARFNRPTDSLTAIASGKWPVYRSDRLINQEVAEEPPAGR